MTFEHSSSFAIAIQENTIDAGVRISLECRGLYLSPSTPGLQDGVNSIVRALLEESFQSHNTIRSTLGLSPEECC